VQRKAVRHLDALQLARAEQTQNITYYHHLSQQFLKLFSILGELRCFRGEICTLLSGLYATMIQKQFH